MSKGVRTFDLDLPRERALAACRVAVASLNWELGETSVDQVSGRQDPARLCCGSAPVEVEIALTSAGEQMTAVALHGKVPGFGPIASRDLRGALSALELAIRRY